MHKYLFYCFYKDGSTYTQNPEDVSVTDQTRSCFYDVDQENVIKFFLTGEGHTYSVDLIDGHFEVDGLKFKMHEEPLSDFRLIYFRRHTHHFNAEHEELAHDVVFRFGWQTTDSDGNNIQRVMEIQ